jgi:hypothetical protein
MDKTTIMQMANSDPKFGQIIDAIEQQLERMPIVAEDLDDAIKMLEFVLNNPDKYQEVAEAAVRDGVIDARQLPPQFDAVFIISLLVALYGLQDRLGQRGYARGGLTVAARRVAAAGRGGDSMLAHINPREAAMLQAMGGSGTINPQTGLREYKGLLGKIIGAVAPIALSFIAPGIGTAIGSALGAGATFAPIVGGAVMGGLTSAISGGNPLVGAVTGGLGAGLGGQLGSAVAPGASEGVQSAIGSGLIGAGTSALQGKNPITGALTGAASGYLGSSLSGSGLPEGVVRGLRGAGNALTAGGDLKQSALSGLASGLMGGGTQKPAPIEDRSMPADGVYRNPEYFSNGQSTIQSNPQTTNMVQGPDGVMRNPDYFGNAAQTPAQQAVQETSQSGSGLFGGLNAKTLIGGALALNALTSAPPDVQKAVQGLTPEQQAYFNRPSIQWDWNKLQQDANQTNLSLDQYMARYWPQITSGQYNMQTPKMAGGGALSNIARMARGAGSGRADTIDAKLSDGEYVMDAETVALLGDGSTEEGARRLDEMRAKLRKQKGKVLAKGKFSPAAKSPLAYIQGAA